MTRLAFVATIIAAAACGAPSKPPAAANIKPSTRYTLQPIGLRGGEGRHSSSHSKTTLRGALELAGSQVKLHLERTLAVSTVHCPNNEPTFGRQACAPRGDDGSTTITNQVFAGEAQWSGANLTATLRDKTLSLALACSEKYLGYECTIDDGGKLFSPIGDRPSRFLFAATTPKLFDLEPSAAPSGDVIRGTLAMQADATAALTLQQGAKTIERRAGIERTAAGLVIRGGTTASSFSFICAEEGTRLSCDVFGPVLDHGEVLAKAVFVAKGARVE